MTGSVKVIEKRCKSCGICQAYCPKDVFDLVPGKKIQVARPENCVACGMCELRCPDFALEVTKHE